jgi:pimeloyl-ACP methyl ester carboxylesterase
MHVEVTAPWRRRLLAPQVGFPVWAREKPDRMVYGSSRSGKWEVYAVDRVAGTDRQITDRPSGTMRFAIEPDGERVWWFDDAEGNERGGWVVESFDGTTRHPASDRLPAAYDAGLVLGRGFALVGTSDDDGVAIWLLADGGPPRPLYQHRQHARLAAASRDERLFVIEHAEHGNSLHRALRVLDLAGDTHGQLWDGPGRGLRAGPWSPVPGDQRLLVTREVDGLNRPAVWSPAADEIVDLAVDLPGDVSCADWFPDARTVLLAQDFRGRTTLHRYDLESAERTSLDTPPGSVERSAVRPNGEVWYRWSDSRTPYGVYQGRTLLFGPEPHEYPPGVGYTDVQAGDIHAFLAEPSGDPPHPSVFLVHGGPLSHDSDVFNARVQAWVDHGVAVVLVNYRGSTGYGTRWRDAIIGDPGFGQLEDIGAVRDHLVDKGLCDPDRSMLAGHSWGGYVALLGAGTEPDRWCAALADAPVADYEAAFEDEMDSLKMLDIVLFGGTPRDRPEFYRERSPLTYVDKVRAPLLILASLNDPRCPIRQVENYVARLAELGHPHEVVRLDFGHGAHVVSDAMRKLETQLRFAGTVLGHAWPRDEPGQSRSLT